MLDSTLWRSLVTIAISKGESYSTAPRIKLALLESKLILSCKSPIRGREK